MKTYAAIIFASILSYASGDCHLDPSVTKQLGWTKIGLLKTRTAAELPNSPNSWSIGAETMGRNFTVFSKWSSYLPALGAKRARVQGGWARTEAVRGQYEWAWMDEIGEARDAFLNWSTAMVQRYGPLGVSQWELWNEPLHAKEGAEAYADFALEMARTVRAVQPSATIIAGVTAGVNMGLAEEVAKVFQAAGALDLLDQISFHPYSYNPDTSYDSIAGFRKALHAIAPKTTIFQGENGAPSQGGDYGALAGYNWTECSQAKWATRRLLGDAARSIPSNLFSMVDMCYDSKQNYKGVLAVQCPDPTVTHAKLAYYAAQRLFSAVPSTFAPAEGANTTLVLQDPLPAPKREPTREGPDTQAFAFEGPGGATLLAYWGSKHTPVNGDQTGTVQAKLESSAAAIREPALLDLLTGLVYAYDEAAAGSGSRQSFVVPATDSAVIVTERSLLPVQGE